MLAIDERMDAVGRLAGLEKQRIAALPHERIEGEHCPQCQRADPERALRHPHQHAFAEGLLVAAWTRLIVEHAEDGAVQHGRPAAERAGESFHWRRDPVATICPTHRASWNSSRARPPSSHSFPCPTCPCRPCRYCRFCGEGFAGAVEGAGEGGVDGIGMVIGCACTAALSQSAIDEANQARTRTSDMSEKSPVPGVYAAAFAWPARKRSACHKRAGYTCGHRPADWRRRPSPPSAPAC